MNSFSIVRRDVSIPHGLRSAPVPEVLKRIFASRGVSSARELTLPLKDLLPPDSMAGLQSAAVLLADAVESDASVIIIGDFDADGATSCALAVSVLRQMGLRDVRHVVPNRFEYGYGLTPEIVGLAAAGEPDLLVTVDNGISSLEGAIAAQELGISLIITDHHLPGEQLPVADVIVNPNQPGCEFAGKNLAGVGVIFYVMTALRAELRQRGWFAEMGITPPNLGDTLDLVALGTVADVVPLDRNNRILVAAGLAKIRQGRARPGIEALFEVAGRDFRRATSADLGFSVGPRLNAAGRLEDMSLGISCLLAESSNEAIAIAERLNGLNQERRDIERSMHHDAIMKLDIELGDTDTNCFGICLFRADWHQGVVGIVAARVREQYQRPTIVFAPADDGQIKGSGRSTPGVHLRDLLGRVATKNPDLIKKFGGHAMAAGLQIESTSFAAFTKLFNAEVRECFSGVMPGRTHVTDGELQAGQMTLSFARTLAEAAPWGQQFVEPSFDGVFDVISYRIVGKKHIKCRLSAGRNELDAIQFNADLKMWQMSHPLRLRVVYSLRINEFRGDCNLQLLVKACEPVSCGGTDLPA